MVIQSNFSEWRGYYLACESQFEYKCEAGLIEEGKFIGKSDGVPSNHYFEQRLSIDYPDQFSMAFKMLRGF